MRVACWYYTATFTILHDERRITINILNGGSNSTFGSIANVFAPSKTQPGIGNWTVIISTMPKQPCNYTIEATHLVNPIKTFPVELRLDDHQWGLSEFTAELASPVSFFVDNSEKCDLINVKYILATSGTVETIHGTVSDLVNGVIVNTLGTKASTYVVGFHNSPMHVLSSSCTLHLSIKKHKVVPLAADGKSKKIDNNTTASSDLNFRVPYSPTLPFTKMIVIGTSTETEDNINFMFYGDSFYASSAAGVVLGINQPGLFITTGSPTMFIPDTIVDEEKEDYLFTLSRSSVSGGANLLQAEITLYSTTTTKIEIGKKVQGTLTAGPHMTKTQDQNYRLEVHPHGLWEKLM